MGQRANAENLDLNRDNTKLETAEARSLARLLTEYDPHIAIDLHTTNGSDHGFYLTYETSVSPNTSPGITSLVRGDLLPSVTRAVKAKHGWSYFYYGGPARSGERVWAGDLDLYKPRYTQTYFGIRNRIGILSETYSYASFEDRIKSNYWFLEEIVNYAVKNGEAIRKATGAADAESIIGTPQAVRGRMVKAKDPVEIVLADVVDERNRTCRIDPCAGASTAASASRRCLTSVSLKAPRPASRRGVGDLGRAGGDGGPPPAVGQAPAAAPPAGGRPARSSSRSAGAGRARRHGRPVRPADGQSHDAVIASVVDRLEAHGIKYFKTSKEMAFKGERFKIASSEQAQAEYQGTHKLRTITGAWETTEQTVPAGSLVIPMDQPLARLAFILIDPRSDDGLMAWNILDPILGATPAPEFYPCSGRWRRSRGSMRRAEVLAASVAGLRERRHGVGHSASNARVRVAGRPRRLGQPLPLPARPRRRVVGVARGRRAAPRPEDRRALAHVLLLAFGLLIWAWTGV